MKDKIQKEILIIIEKKKPIPPNLNVDNFRYFETGHVDSLGLMKFIVQIEDKYKIEISEDDMQNDNFQSVAGLASIIASKLKGCRRGY